MTDCLSDIEVPKQEVRFGKRSHLYLVITFLVAYFVHFVWKQYGEIDNTVGTLFLFTFFNLLYIIYVCYYYYFIIRLKKIGVPPAIVWAVFILMLYMMFFRVILSVFILDYITEIKNEQVKIWIELLLVDGEGIPHFLFNGLVAIVSVYLIRNKLAGKIHTALIICGVINIFLAGVSCVFVALVSHDASVINTYGLATDLLLDLLILAHIYLYVVDLIEAQRAKSEENFN